MDKLKGMRVAILCTDMVEEIELVEPRKALEEAGAVTDLIAPKEGEVLTANHFDKSLSYPVDVLLDEARPEEYDAVLLPGGALNADFLRVNKKAQDFIRNIDEEGKPIAVICHGPWLLVSAGIVEDRQLTSFHTLQDDLINAGAEWSDQPVVIDRNWISSRKPDDLTMFIKAMIALYASSRETTLKAH